MATEPISTTAGITFASGAATATAVQLLGVTLGLRPDLLFAGFIGVICAIFFLNAEPRSEDTFADLLKTSLRRLLLIVVSVLAACFIAPVVPSFVTLSGGAETIVERASAFIVGCFLQALLVRIGKKVRGEA